MNNNDDTTQLNVTVKTSTLASSLVNGLGDAGVMNLIKNIDEAVCDWDFTRELHAYTTRELARADADEVRVEEIDDERDE